MLIRPTDDSINDSFNFSEVILIISELERYLCILEEIIIQVVSEIGCLRKFFQGLVDDNALS
jgi:hypothetical protein